MVNAVVAECKRRGYLKPQTLAVLTLAIDEHWPTIPPGFFDQLDTLQHPTIDHWYNLAQLRGQPAFLWQAYKGRLYVHIREAEDIYDGAPTEEDPLSALSDDEQHQLVADVKALRQDVANLAAQLGPTLPGWPSLGKNAAGQELTWRDAFGVVKADVAAIKKKLLG